MKDPIYFWFGSILQFMHAPRKVVARMIHEAPGYWAEAVVCAYTVLFGFVSLLFGFRFNPVFLGMQVVIGILGLYLSSLVLYFVAMVFGGATDFRSGKMVFAFINVGTLLLFLFAIPLLSVGNGIATVLFAALALYWVYICVSAFGEFLDLNLFQTLMVLMISGFGVQVLQQILFGQYSVFRLSIG